ncbi:MAG: putative two-component system response regulator [Frankiales bacterium]|nr:putative two-component system response regulator [Frankiales bacterium]
MIATTTSRGGIRPAPVRVPSSTGDLVRVLVVDAHPLTRCGLVRLADEQPDLQTVGESGSVAEALRMAAALRPDVITIETSLPDGSGLDLARQLRDRYAGVGIVILTSHGEDDVLFRALDSGASAFVSKSAVVSEVLGAIRHSAVAATSFSATGLAQALRRRQETTQRLALSTRERQVLQLLLAGHSVPEISAKLYLSVSTSKTYVARLYEKLGANNRAQALMAAVRLGLVEDALVG